MRIHWFIGFPVDTALQFTSRNEVSRAMLNLGHEVKLSAAFKKHQIQLEGFSAIEYIHYSPAHLISKLKLHWRLFRSFLSTESDIVFFGHPFSVYLPFTLFKRLKQLRPLYVLDIRSLPVDLSSTLRGTMTLLFFKMSLILADWFVDGVTVITPELGRSVRPYLKRNSNRLGVWTSGVDLNRFKRKGPDKRAELGLEGKTILFYHGVLSPKRGLENAVRALDLLHDEIPELVFMLVGTGPAIDELSSLAEELNLSQHILLPGKVAYENIPEYVRLADCAILPFPDIEGWNVSSPIKLMEYLATGVPIVATDIEAHRNIVNQTGGAILVKSEQPELLADGIRRAIKNGLMPADQNLLEQIISWNSQAKNLEKFLLEMLGRKNQCDSNDE